MQVDRSDFPVLIRTDSDGHLHFMTGRSVDKTFFSCKDDLGRFARLISNKSRIYLTDSGLFCPDPAADAGFYHTNPGLGNIQRPRHNSSDMERYLRGRDDLDSSINIFRRKSAKRFHHRLIHRLGMVNFFHPVIAFRQNFFYVAFSSALGGTEVSFRTGSFSFFCHIIFFRMNDHRMIFCLRKIQYRLQHFIVHLDHPHRPVYAGFIFSCHNSHRIAHIAYPVFQNLTIVRTWFRKRLSCLSISARRHVFIGKYSFNSRNFFCRCCPNLLDPGMGMGTS